MPGKAILPGTSADEMRTESMRSRENLSGAHTKSETIWVGIVRIGNQRIAMGGQHSRMHYFTRGGLSQ